MDSASPHDNSYSALMGTGPHNEERNHPIQGCSQIQMRCRQQCLQQQSQHPHPMLQLYSGPSRQSGSHPSRRKYQRNLPDRIRQIPERHPLALPQQAHP
jgi:hypothetical protein